MGNHLGVVGTDLDLTVHASTEAIGINDGVCVAPAKLLADIVRSLEPGAVTIESEGEKIEIGAARSRFSLRTFPVDDFPSLPEPPQPATFLPAASLASALRQVVRAASSDDARPLLTGVLIAPRAAGIRLVATDSYRLALRDIEGSDAFDRHLPDSGAGPGPGRAATVVRPRIDRQRRAGAASTQDGGRPRWACRSAITT